MNEGIEADAVNEIREDLDFYIEAYSDDPDFLESYDEEFYYENLGLDGAGGTGANGVTAPPPVLTPEPTKKELREEARKEKKASKVKVRSCSCPRLPYTIT